MGLHQSQQLFQSYLTHCDAEPFKKLVVNDSVSSDKRIQVYFNAYRLRLFDICSEEFPKTHTLMGDDHFKAAFLGYLDSYPSSHFSVRYFGKQFSYYLANSAPFKDEPIFSEMAKFEWLIGETLDAKNAETLSIKALSQVPPENWGDLRFTFHPSLRHNRFSYNTAKLWLAIDSEAPPIAPKKLETPQYWLFWRSGIKSLFESASPAQFAILQSIFSGKSFSQICERLTFDLPEEQVPQFVAQTLHHWIENGMLAQ